MYAPVRLPRNKPEAERYQPRYKDSPEVVRWRQRMATGEAKGSTGTGGYCRMGQCSGAPAWGD